jgi:hypothetical protein
MSVSSRVIIAIKALCQLDLKPLVLYSLYQLGLRTGHYKRISYQPSTVRGQRLKTILPIPDPTELVKLLGDEGLISLFKEADEIVTGKVRLFGGEPVDLKLTFDGSPLHWTNYETGKVKHEGDIKYIWEPARFGWAYTLGRAYHLRREERYAEAFWRLTETFLDANPPYLGPQWMSGQEVALRIMAFVWAVEVFAVSSHSTAQRLERLAQAVAEHAARIPPTLVYARSQNNNHLLTEAAGLFTAGLALPEHPQAGSWYNLGWKWLNRGLRDQIDGYGEYCQHSTNYQRLMLQAALWVTAILQVRGEDWPRLTMQALVRATHWLYTMLDWDSGCVPNLGANDGAYILPLTVCPFEDYRPVIQAAARAFLKYQLPNGVWNEMSTWLGFAPRGEQILPDVYLNDNLHGKDSWGYLRAVQFKSRPGHSDQLHLDLWWRGLNIAQDAGTYLYNGTPPWDNPLTMTAIHNTVTVNSLDQMTRAGRYLYLDWAHAFRRNHIVTDPGILQRVTGRHHGYWRLGIRHERTVSVYQDGHWQVEDDIVHFLPIWKINLGRLNNSLHWLFPDWRWQIEEESGRVDIRLKTPYGWMIVRISSDIIQAVRLIRSGELIYGSGEVSPVFGWVSPTYGKKVPALSLDVDFRSSIITSEFIFPK